MNLYDQNPKKLLVLTGSLGGLLLGITLMVLLNKDLTPPVSPDDQAQMSKFLSQSKHSSIARLKLNCQDQLIERVWIRCQSNLLYGRKKWLESKTKGKIARQTEGGTVSLDIRLKNKQAWLGHHFSNNWRITSMHEDPSLLRRALSHWLYRSIRKEIQGDELDFESDWSHLVQNQKYRGIYWLEEKPSRDIFSIDRFVSPLDPHGLIFRLDSKSAYKISQMGQDKNQYRVAEDRLLRQIFPDFLQTSVSFHTQTKTFFDGLRHDPEKWFSDLSPRSQKEWVIVFLHGLLVGNRLDNDLILAWKNSKNLKEVTILPLHNDESFGLIDGEPRDRIGQMSLKFPFDHLFRSKGFKQRALESFEDIAKSTWQLKSLHQKLDQLERKILAESQKARQSFPDSPYHHYARKDQKLLRSWIEARHQYLAQNFLKWIKGHGDRPYLSQSF